MTIEKDDLKLRIVELMSGNDNLESELVKMEQYVEEADKFKFKHNEVMGFIAYMEAWITIIKQ